MNEGMLRIDETMWFDIPERPNYQTNCYGIIKSLGREIWGKSRGNREFKYFKRGRILKQYDNGQGYLWAKMGAKTKPMYIHRIVATVFIPNPDNLPAVNHKDCIKSNNHYSNLEWVSYSDNSKHAHKNGRLHLPKDTIGSKNGNAKLKERDVLAILALKGKKDSTKLAKQFKTTRHNIYNILRGTNWKHLHK